MQLHIRQMLLLFSFFENKVSFKHKCVVFKHTCLCAFSRHFISKMTDFVAALETEWPTMSKTLIRPFAERVTFLDIGSHRHY